MFLDVPMSIFFEYPMSDLAYSYIGTDGLDWFEESDGSFCSFSSTNLSAFSINGVTLDKNRDELVGIFGDPIYEDWESGYVRFKLTNYYINFFMGAPANKAFLIDVYILQ
jgi:hypothetical protein